MIFARYPALNMQKASLCKFARATDGGVLFARDEIYCILIIQYIRNFIFERRFKVCRLLDDLILACFCLFFGAKALVSARERAS